MVRTRWAAIGAAVAVVLGAGGLGIARAAISSGEKPVTVTVDAARIVDTRNDVGLAGAFSDASPREVQVTGDVPVAPSGTSSVVPDDAIGVLVNVTVVAPSSNGFLSLRSGGASGAPSTSTVNFVAGVNTPNAATVDLSPDGGIQIWVDTTDPAGSAHVLLDVVGYTVDHDHDDRYYTESEVDSLVGSAAEGVPGPVGPKGEPGADAPRPARVISVATSGGDFTSLSAALASITDATSSNPYLVRIAPGTYTEAAPVELVDFVHVEGSGIGATTITCACGGPGPLTGAVLVADEVDTEVRHLGVVNAGGGVESVGIATSSTPDDSTSLLHVRAVASGGTDRNVGVSNRSPGTPAVPQLTDVEAVASGGSVSIGIDNNGASAVLTNVRAEASGATTGNYAVSNGVSKPILTNVTAAATGPGNARNVGVYVEDATPRLVGVTTILGGDFAYGLYVDSGQVTVHESRLIGDSAAVFVFSGSARIASSELSGGVSGDNVHCFSAFDGTEELGPDCGTAVRTTVVASAPDADGVIAQSTPTDIASVTVVTGSPGTVAVYASGYMGENTPATLVECGITDTSATSPPEEARVWWRKDDSGQDVGNYSNLSTSRVFAGVGTTPTVTYYLVCTNRSGGTSSVLAPQMTAIFVPDS